MQSRFKCPFNFRKVGVLVLLGLTNVQRNRLLSEVIVNQIQEMLTQLVGFWGRVIHIEIEGKQ